ncbi:MltR family transcriptional regulator [Novosphingobium sp.]|uniref:MltR family transcriptional regulator n=1 Tax=Novosphingobium sp. TaxID=1874826 RepID=UPI003BACAC7D
MASDHVQDLITTLQQTGARQLNDRVCAIISAAFIEGCLGDLIVTKMPSLNGELRKKMFEGTGALSTAAARMDVAFALGIIEKSWYNDLIQIARIRNRFAHNVRITSFEDGDIPEIIGKMRYRLGDGQDYGDQDAQARAYLREDWDKSGNREKFNSTASYLIITLSNLVCAAERTGA